MDLLSQRTIGMLPDSVQIPQQDKGEDRPQIVHIGIGGFHRSHQAYALYKLSQLDPQAFGKWSITGVGLMPADKLLVQNFRDQDHLYALRTVAYDNQEEVFVIDSIKEMLHASTDADHIVQRIADKTTKIISFTITEGGYNMDFESHRFMIENPLVQNDLQNKDTPQTVFGFLAKGIGLRMARSSSPLCLLSCDNILGNGEILRNALLSFLEAYDVKIKSWAEAHITFPNSMVDRITPVTTATDRDAFEEKYGVRDNCLVVSEDFFQWVIEKKTDLNDFPPLENVGVTFVEDVSPYEAMKLGILNAGHTLVGLLGDAMGYDRIHTSVADPLIAKIYEKYIYHEVIPVLQPLAGVDYTAYFKKVRNRFANALINDSTARIISGSSDKFPKFVLPIIQKQLKSSKPQTDIALLLIVLWWVYLEKEFNKNRMADVQDQIVSQWIPLFEAAAGDGTWFIHYRPIFGKLGRDPEIVNTFQNYLNAIQQGSIGNLIDKISTKYYDR